jgi:long-chain acyl-CoA synthetase
MSSTWPPEGRRTIVDYLQRWNRECPDRVWLRERNGDEYRNWTWGSAAAEVDAIAAWLEGVIGDSGARVAVMSRNRAHWVLADLAIIASGNVTVPIFTTLPLEGAQYVLDFSEADVLFIGESENWATVREIVPQRVKVVALPGVEPGVAHERWDDLLAAHAGSRPRHVCRHDELVSVVFTSGTTAAPKGVMQTHDSMLVPMERAGTVFGLRPHPRFLSYLPMAHIAERQLVAIQSLIQCGSITFNEGLPFLVRDMADTRPNFFFGAPRVWEQLQQGILAKFGSQEALDSALARGGEAVREQVKKSLGLQEADYLLTAAAPTPPSLIEWYDRLGIQLMEGFGQTEAMALIVNAPGQRRIGSIGRKGDGVEVRIDPESSELMCRAAGLAMGYYRMPEQTAETFVDGWVRTGDTARVDEDGYYYITGRVKEYFKTIQGKFVSPAPIEGEFAESLLVEQQCLLGRGFSKTVMVCVLSALGQQQPKEQLERELRKLTEDVNGRVEKHARIGALIVTREPWTIESGMLTPTLKLRRHEVDARFGARAEALARGGAERGKILLEWDTN